MAVVKATRDLTEKALRETDWAAQDALTDADIARQIAANPDAAPDLTIERAKLLFRLEAGSLAPRHKIRLLRRALGLSQSQFSLAYAIPLRTLQNWEQGTRTPDEAAMALIKLIAHRPEMVKEVLGEHAA